MSKKEIKKQLLLAIKKDPLKKNIKKVSLFGSYVNGKPSKSSDVDILIEFKPNFQIGYFGLAQIQRNFGKCIGKNVDILTKQSISKYFRDQVLKESEIVYEE